jgi:hypothetical protein
MLFGKRSARLQEIHSLAQAGTKYEISEQANSVPPSRTLTILIFCRSLMAFLSAAGRHANLTNAESPRREPEKPCTAGILRAYFWHQSPLVILGSLRQRRKDSLFPEPLEDAWPGFI